jgi:NAD(P)-dependent dehydrogenase (short-subunit alcohol dehydrogenase family)
MKYSKWIDKHIQDLRDKTIIITGANSGLGFECCRALLYKKANIIMACRNLEKANKAKEKDNVLPHSTFSVLQ